MPETTGLPLAEAVRSLRLRRSLYALARGGYASALATFQEQHAGEIEQIAKLKAAVASLEEEIRTRGAVIAQATREAPCPGTKVHFERVVRYLKTTEFGELVYMTPEESDEYLVRWAVSHGWTGLVKANRTACEKQLRKLDESLLPPGAAIEWATRVSIDEDLSDLSKEDADARD